MIPTPKKQNYTNVTEIEIGMIPTSPYSNTHLGIKEQPPSAPHDPRILQAAGSPEKPGPLAHLRRLCNHNPSAGFVEDVERP